MAFVTATSFTKLPPMLSSARSLTLPLRSLRERYLSKTSRRVRPVASAEQPEEQRQKVVGDASQVDETPFPALYDAWFGPEHQLSSQVQEAVTTAYNGGVRDMELQWPVVPNLEEIDAGTMLNMEFGKQIAEEFGMSAKVDYQLIKRYLASFCNLWWVARLSQCEAFKSRTVWAIYTDSISKARAQPFLKNVRLSSMRDKPTPAPGDVVVVIDPRYDENWRKGMALKPKDGCIVFLNSQFNESYGLTGPRRGALKDVRCVYFLRRLTRGFVFYSYPGPWRACLENPDMSIEVLKRYEKEPKLRDVAAVVRQESNNRYGGFHNDRYVKGFGGRL